MAAIRQNLALLRKRIVGSHGILFSNGLNIDMDEATSMHRHMSCNTVSFRVDGFVFLQCRPMASRLALKMPLVHATDSSNSR